MGEAAAFNSNRARRRENARALFSVAGFRSPPTGVSARECRIRSPASLLATNCNTAEGFQARALANDGELRRVEPHDMRRLAASLALINEVDALQRRRIDLEPDVKAAAPRALVAHARIKIPSVPPARPRGPIGKQTRSVFPFGDAVIASYALTSLVSCVTISRF